MFADPFNTPGLVIDNNMHEGFRFEVWDIIEGKNIYLDAPSKAGSSNISTGPESFPSLYTKPSAPTFGGPSNLDIFEYFNPTGIKGFH